MKVLIKHISQKKEEQVIIECVNMTKEFEDIKEYVLMKGNVLTGYLNGAVYLIQLADILYFEAVGEEVFAYTNKEVYFVKNRLYELEELYKNQKFIRCSKSVLINILMVESIRPTLNSRYLIKMKNGEDLMVSRLYAKQVKQRIMEERVNGNGDFIEMKTEWVKCPICGHKTRNKMREDTILKKFPLFCPKCKQEILIDIEDFVIKVVNEPDAKTQSQLS